MMIRAQLACHKNFRLGSSNIIPDDVYKFHYYQGEHANYSHVYVNLSDIVINSNSTNLIFCEHCGNEILISVTDKKSMKKVKLIIITLLSIISIIAMMIPYFILNISWVKYLSGFFLIVAVSLLCSYFFSPDYKFNIQQIGAGIHLVKY